MKTKNNKLTAIILWIFSIILFIVSIFILWINNKNTQASIINNMQSNILKRIDNTNIKKAKNKNANFKANTTKDANAKTIVYNKLHNDNLNAIGCMSIPKIKMINPIFNGYGINGTYLALGACTMKPNQQMGKGNYALAGHYMASNTVFHSLNKVKIGMNVYLTNLKKIYVYKVVNTTIINKFDVNIINDIPNEKIVTLITCTQLNQTPYRTLVQGNLINIIPATKNNLKKYSLKN